MGGVVVFTILGLDNYFSYPRAEFLPPWPVGDPGTVSQNLTSHKNARNLSSEIFGGEEIDRTCRWVRSKETKRWETNRF